MQARVSGPSGAVQSPFAAVLFDMDGVLLDSEVWWHEVRLEFARVRGLRWTEEDRASVMGLNTREWSATTRRRLGIEEPDEEIARQVVDAMVARFGSESPPRIPGAAEVVRRIAGQLPIAVASGAHREIIAAALRSIGVAEAFDAIVSADDVPVGKPAPDVYLEAARQLGVDARDCLVVEDSYNGLLAGRAAGCTVAFVPNPSFAQPPAAYETADVVLDGIMELLVLPRLAAALRPAL